MHCHPVSHYLASEDLIHPTFFCIKDLVVFIIIHDNLHQAIIQRKMVFSPPILLVVVIHSHAIELIVHCHNNISIQVRIQRRLLEVSPP